MNTIGIPPLAVIVCLAPDVNKNVLALEVRSLSRLAGVAPGGPSTHEEGDIRDHIIKDGNFGFRGICLRALKNVS